MPSRRNTRRNRRSSRKNGGGGLFGKLYGPIHQALGLGSNVAGAVTNTTRNVIKRGVRGVDRVGLKITGRANSAVRGLLSRRNSRRNRRN